VHTAVTSVLNYYGGSLASALRSIYPEHTWEDWKFNRAPSHYWENVDIESLRSFVDDLAVKLGITDVKSPTEWSQISFRQLQAAGASHIALKYGGLINVLTKVYPDVDWTVANFSNRGKRSTQRLLRLALEQIFPNEDIKEEYRDARMKYQDSNAAMELDFVLPVFNLAIEFQGIQHYRDAIKLGEFRAYRARDLEKQAAAREVGLTLITVPYWWDLSVSSLINTIHQHRPDIVPRQVGNGESIPSQEPENHPLRFASKKAKQMASLFMLPMSFDHLDAGQQERAVRGWYVHSFLGWFVVEAYSPC
jgi:hypothetical protein